MIRTMLKSTIHRATVSKSDLHYVGSITIDRMLAAADLHVHEQVTVVDVENGARFQTYMIAGEPRSREIKVNSAAARLVHTGDAVILIYGQYAAEELGAHLPKVVHVDRANRIIAIDAGVASLHQTAGS